MKKLSQQTSNVFAIIVHNVTFFGSVFAVVIINVKNVHDYSDTTAKHRIQDDNIVVVVVQRDKKY